MMINAMHRLPALKNAEVKMLLNGPESFTVDGSFLLGETAETKGLFLENKPYIKQVIDSMERATSGTKNI